MHRWNPKCMSFILSHFERAGCMGQYCLRVHTKVHISLVKNTVHLLHMGWRNFFSTCAVVSVFWLWWEIVLWQEIVLKMRTPFDFLWVVSTKKSYWVTLLWSDSQCEYFVRPNTILLCIFLFCIFLLHCIDPQVEVQIRILLKEAAIVSKMQTPAITLWFPEHRFKEYFYFGFFIKEKQFASQDVFLVKSKHWVLAKNLSFCVFVLCLAGFLFESFFFSKSRLCTRPLFSHFVSNLDQLACQLILWIHLWGQSCGRQLYESTTLQSRLFLKNIKSFFYKLKWVNSCIIPSMHAERKITVCSHKHSFTPYPSLSPYWRTDNWQRNKYTCCAWAGGTFFSSCAVVSVFLVLAGNWFWCYLLMYLEYNTVVALC